MRMHGLHLLRSLEDVWPQARGPGTVQPVAGRSATCASSSQGRPASWAAALGCAPLPATRRYRKMGSLCSASSSAKQTCMVLKEAMGLLQHVHRSAALSWQTTPLQPRGAARRGPHLARCCVCRISVKWVHVSMRGGVLPRTKCSRVAQSRPKPSCGSVPLPNSSTRQSDLHAPSSTARRTLRLVQRGNHACWSSCRCGAPAGLPMPALLVKRAARQSTCAWRCAAWRPSGTGRS